MCIEAVCDSGAEETVAPRGACPGRARTSAMSRAGACDRTASGAPIPNLGELDVQFLTSVGYPAEIPFQLVDIERPLIAVSALAKDEFNEKGGKITHHSGKVTGLERRGDTYILRKCVPIEECHLLFNRQPSSGETAPRQRQLLPQADPVSPSRCLQPLQAGDGAQVAASPAEVRLPESAAGRQTGAGEDPCAVEGS